MPTLDQHVRAFLSERRLSDDEVFAVMKLVKGDPSYSNLTWGASATEIDAAMLDAIRKGISRKVLAWMNRYRSNHPARALFTGES